MITEFCFAVVGLIIIFLVSWGVSTDRSAMLSRIPRPIILVLCQFLCGYVLLRTNIGAKLIAIVNAGFQAIMGYAKAGISFVFGPINTITVNHSNPAFFFAVLCPSIVISGIIGILHWCGILSIIIRVIGTILSKISGVDKLHSFYTLSSLVLGQDLAPMSIKNYIPGLNKRQLLSLGIGSMSMVAFSILGSYMQLIGAKFVITAVVLNTLGIFVIVSMVNPPQPEDFKQEIHFLSERKPFFLNLGDYLLDGGKIVAIISIMLIGFTAILALLNGIFLSISGMSFEEILGYIFSPVAILTGVAPHDAVKIGSYMATKLLTNEFIAMSRLASAPHILSYHTQAIISTYLVSFANLSSIGICSGAFRIADETSGKYMAVIGLRCLFTSCLVSLLTSVIVGLLTL